MDKKKLSMLVCPLCKGPLELKPTELWCYFDKLAYPIQAGIPMMLVDTARRLSLAEWEARK